MDFVRSIRQEGERFYAAASAVADPETGVPSCPEWTIADLVWHLGEVHWFWATIIERRATAAGDVEALKPVRPESFAELQSWGHAQMEFLVDMLESTSDEVRVWTWALDPADHSVGFIRRHQVQEAAVHRWDLQAAATTATPDPIAADAAADSIDELLTVTLPWGVNENKPLAGSVHLHCTDVDGEWFIEATGKVDRAHARGDVALRGSASDLLLALYKRIPLDGLEVIGDQGLAREVMARMDGS